MLELSYVASLMRYPKLSAIGSDLLAAFITADMPAE